MQSGAKMGLVSVDLEKRVLMGSGDDELRVYPELVAGDKAYGGAGTDSLITDLDPPAGTAFSFETIVSGP